MVPHRARRADAGAAPGLAAPSPPASTRSSWPRPAPARRWPPSSPASISCGARIRCRRGVRVLYVSPLKALNNDIHRNLQVPLEGVAETARRMGQPLPGPRSGRPHRRHARRRAAAPGPQAAARPHHHAGIAAPAADLARPRHAARRHALSSSMRFTPCARTSAASSWRCCWNGWRRSTRRGFVRIGLSATQRPLRRWPAISAAAQPDGDGRLAPRPVTIVDAGLRKDLDLRVVSPVEQFGPLPEKSVWPSIYRLLGEQIREHRSTIVFANNRRSVERITPLPRTRTERSCARAHHGSVAWKCGRRPRRR